MDEFEQKIRCQSCGMPLAEGFYGTNVDGSYTADYCRFCFAYGAFREPDITLQEMIQRSADYMIARLNISKEEAHRLSGKMIPTLARWTGRAS